MTDELVSRILSDLAYKARIKATQERWAEEKSAEANAAPETLNYDWRLCLVADHNMLAATSVSVGRLNGLQAFTSARTWQVAEDKRLADMTMAECAAILDRGAATPNGSGKIS